ncbi:MAG: NitT/TauT family transport system substrate-binding protein [Chloroflexota bacterium]|nr:NitT/TauT family transport system substrate-binding protein [Chloroflexota bacterium]
MSDRDRTALAKPTRREFLGLAGVGALGLLAACSSPAGSTPTAQLSAGPAGTTDNAAFSVGYLVGGIDIPINVIKQLGLVQKYGLNVEFKQFGDPNVLNDAWLNKQITFQPGMDTAQAAAKKLQNGYGLAAFSTFLALNKIVVKTASPLKTIADLKGQKLAVVGNQSEFLILQSWLKSDHGIDLLKDVDVRIVAPPVAVQLWTQGDVAATLLFEPFASSLLFGGKGRVIWDVQQEWQKKFGQPLWFSAYCVDDSFAKAHPVAVKNYFAAYKEAVTYINANAAAVYQGYKTDFKITDDADYQLLLKNLQFAPGFFSTKWDDAVIGSIKKYLQIAVDLGQLKSIPDQLFTKDFA